MLKIEEMKRDRIKYVKKNEVVFEYEKHSTKKYPCRNCKYFEICGNTNRTQKCNGRELKGKK